MRIDKMTRDEILESVPQGLVVIPVGAIEQHGPHLPLSTDAVIIDEITSKVCEMFTDDIPIFSAPVVSYGNSHHHFPYPAMSLSSETLISVLKDLTQSLATFGCKKVLILNSHGGNDEAIRIVARDMSRKLQISIGAASYWTLAWDQIVKQCNISDLGRIPGHAGGFETSIMLALRPDDVKWESRPPHREDLIPTVDNASRIYISHPNNSVGAGGYSDDSRHASKELGEKMFTVIVEEVYKTVKSFMEVKS